MEGLNIQVKNNYEIIQIRYVFLIVLVFIFFSCSKLFITSGKKEKTKNNYDAAAFNEVYVEGT